MRKSSIYMLVAAIILGLVAVFLARSFLNRSDQTVAQGQAVQTVNVVVAADVIAFGESISAEKLKIAAFPAGALPGGTYSRVTDLTDGDRPRVALRALEPNELLTTTAVSGEGGRLSTSPLFGESMRAVSIPVNEIVGSGGFLVPGDRVDVFMTRQETQETLPYSDLLVQGARVLASGQNADAAAAKPFVVKSVTIEVSPLQAQKLALAQQIGTLSVALRNLTDESRVRLETAQLLDLNDGTRTRILRKAKAEAPAEPGAPVRPTGPTVEIFRGGKDGASSTVYGVPSR